MREIFGTGWRKLPRTLRRAMLLTVAVVLALLGAVLLVLPGPGVPLLIAAVAVLAGEFAWAEILLDKIKEQGRKIDPRALLRSATPPQKVALILSAVIATFAVAFAVMFAFLR